jgi:hypothetical protein
MGAAVTALPEMPIADAARRIDVIEQSAPLTSGGGATFG